MLIQERDHKILLWLLHMQFSHLEHISKVFFKGFNPNRAPYRRMLKLVKEGLVETAKVYTYPRDLYVATRKAVLLLRSIRYRYVPGALKKKRFNNYDHDKRLIDLRILFQELGIGIWVPERVIRSIKPRGSSPDAILMTSETNYAIEYERTVKEPGRYKKIFDHYHYKTRYRAVLYILPSERRIRKLRERIPHISSKIYFISEENLINHKKEAVFRSSSDGISMSRLIKDSRDGSVEDLEPEELKRALHTEPSDGWKERKPFVSPKRSKRSYEDRHWNDEDSSEDDKF